jgi:hypothetical protein
VVHVLTNVLRKVHQSLRKGGSLLIIQPAPMDVIIELEIAGKIKLSEAFHEPNFRKILGFTDEAIHNALTEQLFVIVQEATSPDERLHHAEYRSLDEWIEDHKPLCDDLEELDKLSAKLRESVKGKDHRIIEYWKETTLLLRKTQPERLFR